MNQEELMQKLQVGMQALQDQNLDAAENVFYSLLAVNPSEIHSLHFLGVVACQKGDIATGVDLIEKSISIDSTRFGPFHNLARFLVDDNQIDTVDRAGRQA